MYKCETEFILMNIINVKIEYSYLYYENAN